MLNPQLLSGPASVGTDPVLGTARFTFGFNDLYSGLGVVPVLVGFFCLPQAIAIMAESISGRSSAVP